MTSLPVPPTRIARAPRKLASRIAGAVILANVLVLLVTLVWPEGIVRLTAGVIPRHYVSQFDADPLPDYEGVHGIAHNSGDSLDKIDSAIDAGAHGIEIDVISYRGDLYARHDQPVVVLGEFGFRPVPLADAWEAATTEVVQLDLKETSPTFMAWLVRFLENRQRDPRIVFISSWDPVVLAYFQEKTPWVGRLLSIGTLAEFEDLQQQIEHYEQTGLINGVTMFHELVDRGRVTWLKGHQLLIFAWTVESLARVNELTLLQVDGVVTDDLAILNLLRETRGDGLLATPIAEEATPLAGQPAGNESDTSGQDEGSAEAHADFVHRIHEIG